MSQEDLVQLTDDAGTGDVDADVVTAALIRGAGIIDTHAQQRYTLPLAATDQVKNLNADLAVYFLFQKRGRMRQTVKDAYDSAMALLKLVKEGSGSLDGATLKQASSLGVVTKDHTTSPDTFDADRLKDF